MSRRLILDGTEKEARPGSSQGGQQVGRQSERVMDRRISPSFRSLLCGSRGIHRPESIPGRRLEQANYYWKKTPREKTQARTQGLVHKDIRRDVQKHQNGRYIRRIQGRGLEPRSPGFCIWRRGGCLSSGDRDLCFRRRGRPGIQNLYRFPGGYVETIERIARTWPGHGTERYQSR